MPTFNHSTVAQFRTRLRELYRNSKGWTVVRLGFYIHNLNLTDNQLKNLFGVSDAQLPALKTKLQNLATKYEEVKVQAGE